MDSFRVPRQEVEVHRGEAGLSSARGSCMLRYQLSRVGQQPEDLQVPAEAIIVLLRVHHRQGLRRGLAMVVVIQAT